MRIVLKNVSRIAHADIKLGGITVIGGEDCTGKSAVSKALFGSLVSANKWLEDFGDQIDEDGFVCSPSTKKKVGSERILEEYVSRWFNEIFFNKIGFLSGVSKVDVIFDHGINTITFDYTQDRFNQCDVSFGRDVFFATHYIGNPFVLDYLNKVYDLYTIDTIERNVVENVIKAKRELATDKMTDIFDEAENKEKLQDVYAAMKKVLKGEVKIQDNLYYYCDERGNKIDFRGVSTGLKSFLFIERLLDSVKLKKGDVLIIDKPEAYMHPEWQLVYAEVIVLLQKALDLTVLIITHSFHFLESLDFFMKKHGSFDRSNFYIPRKTKCGAGYTIAESADNLHDIMKSLSQPVFDLSDMKFEFEMEQNQEDRDYKCDKEE